LPVYRAGAWLRHSEIDRAARKTRQQAQELEQRRKPPHVKNVWAPGSMEWAAEQEKARSAAAPDPVPHTPPDID
jgi:hypothetical protein